MSSKEDKDAALSAGGGAAAGFAAGGPIGAIIGGGAALGLTGFGMDAQARARARQRRINEAMSRMYGRLYNDPALSELQVDGTAFDNIQADPQAIEAQRRALAYMGEVQAGKGLTAEDRADLNRIRAQQLATEQGQRQAILQQAARRGGLTSGGTLSAQLNAQQNQANRAQQYGLDTAAQAQLRALNTAIASGQLGGSIREQSFSEAAKKAAARDMLEQFNRTMLHQQFANKRSIMDRQSGLGSDRGESYVQGAGEFNQGLGRIADTIGQTFGSFVAAPSDKKR